MSFINSRYTRRICLNKTIENIFPNGSDGVKIQFTDGTYILVYPNTVVQHRGNTITYDSEIIVNGYNKDGYIINASNMDEIDKINE